MNTTSDWAAYLAASRDASAFRGTYVIRTVKTWGAPASE
jgi:hypothetical protein